MYHRSNFRRLGEGICKKIDLNVRKPVIQFDATARHATNVFG